jgi:hypothetical protein
MEMVVLNQTAIEGKQIMQQIIKTLIFASFMMYFMASCNKNDPNFPDIPTLLPVPSVFVANPFHKPYVQQAEYFPPFTHSELGVVVYPAKYLDFGSLAIVVPHQKKWLKPGNSGFQPSFDVQVNYRSLFENIFV